MNDIEWMQMLMSCWGWVCLKKTGGSNICQKALNRSTNTDMLMEVASVKGCDVERQEHFGPGKASV